MKRLLSTFFTLFCIASMAFAQSSTDIILTGKVLDEKTKEPIAFATIAAMKKSSKIVNGTQTDINGAFRLVVKASDNIAFIEVMLIGFVSKRLTINEFTRSKTDKNVFSKDTFLSESGVTLDEVVVSGYRVSEKKMDRTASVSAMEKISTAKMSRVAPAKPSVTAATTARISSMPKGTIATASAPLMVAYVDGVAIKSEEAMYDKSSVAKAEDRPVGSSLVVVESEKTLAKRDVLKDNKAITIFAEDLIAIPEAADFLKELAKAKATEQAKTAAKMLSEDDDIAPEPSAGQLTAGEWSDLKNWEFWKKSLDETFKTHQNNWKMNFTQRYSVILRGANEQPISDAMVQLISAEGTAIWTAKTDNLGRAELFADAFNKTNAREISVQSNGKTYKLDKIRKIEAGVNELKIPLACGYAPTVDIAFVVDATGSMGDEIAYLKAELADVIRQVKRNNSQLEVRLGSVFYRDFGDAYVTRTFPFDKSLKKNVEFIKNQEAGGGGDTPEAVEEGLAAAIDSMAWSDNAVTRLLFLVLDAPPHLTDKNVEKLQRLAAKAAEKGIRIVPIAASGVDQNTEFLMKALAVATNGTYTFLTDDSGIGNGHLKATTEKHEIELLNALLVRLIKQYSTYEACNNLTAEATTGGDAKFGLNFKAYPNPVRDVLNIEIKTDATDVFITNAQGQTVRKLGIFTEGVQSLDVSDLQSGIYFVHFQKEGRVCTKKISVVK
jgi:hypothetical protein